MANIKWRNYNNIPEVARKHFSSLQIAEVEGYSVMTAIHNSDGRMFSFASPEDRRNFNPEVAIRTMYTRPSLRVHTKNPTLDLKFYMNLATEDFARFHVPRILAKTLA